MNNNCIRCGGTGIVDYSEDDQHYTNHCYHCLSTGKVDDNTLYHDKLLSVAATLAHYHVSDLKKYCDLDPDGEGFNFCAAENMMSERDYFTIQVYDYTYCFVDKLLDMSVDDQKFLIAWNDFLTEDKTYYR